MQYREFGKTGEKISLLGLGGFHIGKPDLDGKIAISLIRKAIDGGITFLDNCWDYNGGASELRMGQALRDGYREKAFLMTKIDGRTREAAERQIDQSLTRLQTDRIDLLQLHEVIRTTDPERFFAPEGAFLAFQKAQKDGKIRYIGFTGHKDPAIHLAMLAAAGERNFRFDAVQMPLNVMDAFFQSFQKQVVPEVRRRGAAVLGMKPLGNPYIVAANVLPAVDLLHYAMDLDTDVVITGIDSLAVLEQGLQAVRTYRRLTPTQRNAMLVKAEQVARTGSLELYKTGRQFDGTEQHPQWLTGAVVS